MTILALSDLIRPLLDSRHPDAARVPSLTTRPFSLAECLHEPPMR